MPLEPTVLGLVLVLAQFALAAFLVVGVPVLMYRDMRSRGRTGWSYVLLYLLLAPVGLLAWYVDRHRFPLPLTG